jgi:anti-sigma factor RsiW
MRGDGRKMTTCEDLEPLLTPYVDGEATAEQRATIEAHLAGCPSCREYADAGAHARELLRACRDRLVTPAPVRLHQKCADLARQEQSAAQSGTQPAAAPAVTMRSEDRRALSWLRWAPVSLLATAALVVIGIFAYSSYRGTALAAQLAADHIYCTGIVGNRAPADLPLSQTTWKNRVGWWVDVPTFRPNDELQFVQLRRCLHDRSVVMAHVLYRRHGRLLSLYVMPENEPTHREELVRGQRTIVWSQGGRTYAVVGADSSAELHELVDRFSHVLP